MRVCSLVFVLALATVFPARAGVLSGDGIGVYGDSMSMQYSFWLPLAIQFDYEVFYNGNQLNWVDLLSQQGYNFGANSAPVLGHTFLTYDAAVSGERSSNLPTQVAALRDDITSGNIKLVVQMIGSNDVNSEQYSFVYSKAVKHNYNPLTDPQVQSFMADVIAHITNSIGVTLTENPATKMILSTIPDVGVTPLYREAYPVARQRAAMTAVTQAMNQQIIALAEQHDFPVVDMFGLSQRALLPLEVGGVSMRFAGGNGGRNEFLSDGFHPGTVVQGLMANAILMANQLAYDDPVIYLTDQYILSEAGVVHDNRTSYFDVSPYVIYSVPEPSTLVLGLAGLMVISTAASHRRIRRA